MFDLDEMKRACERLKAITNELIDMELAGQIDYDPDPCLFDWFYIGKDDKIESRFRALRTEYLGWGKYLCKELNNNLDGVILEAIKIIPSLSMEHYSDLEREP